jgi:FixJ family two-component response regulator
MENTPSWHIFFVDDEPKVRMVVRKTLERVGVSVSCFASPDDCLAHLQTLPCDLLITDVKMPGKDGIELLVEVRKQRPWLPVLVVTGFGDVPMAVRALKEGAADFIEKPLDREAFLETVQTLLEQHSKRNAVVNHDLTKTEMRILRLILEGKNNREIAATLHRSPRTVEVHRSHVMHKMGASNIVELLRRAADMGLFDMNGSGTEQSQPRPAQAD